MKRRRRRGRPRSRRLRLRPQTVLAMQLGVMLADFLGQTILPWLDGTPSVPRKLAPHPEAGEPCTPIDKRQQGRSEVIHELATPKPQ